MANQKKNMTGVWIELEPGVKRILDMLCSAKNIFRKNYTTNAVEDAIIAGISGDTVVFKQALANIDPMLSAAFADLEERVFTRKTGIEPEVAVQKSEEASAYENEELTEPIDLPHEVTP